MRMSPILNGAPSARNGRAAAIGVAGESFRKPQSAAFELEALWDVADET